MCRHLAYLGPPVALAELVLDPEHSLYQQSWAPTDMRGGGSVNADGFGLAWYADGQLVRYRRNVPIWTDDNLPGLARSISSGAVLAAVRNGTDDMPHDESAVAPFVSGSWCFSHNGKIPGWPGSVLKLAEGLPVAELLGAGVDSAFLFALIRARMGEPVAAVESAVREVAEAAPGARLNVLLTDGEQLVATAWTHSLWVRRTDDSTTVSSEPFGAGHWVEVPDHSLLVATATTVRITSMEGPQ
ncbi:ergothioneine biosynthesis protein EgtC [Kribbella sandramycini]|uniref:Gamma-glutamyl-hercynylcysteine sulfoxide hydrolase n=1 Tax=Kribbella sandramycini TaxID=60450 RepID=A0A7Y4P2X5_9ACTN|nr:ergothioneine biosynthesis protein EgtC [Kribbella sandramycini]MBB6571042.1 glutamine amidotransferase [Kribbella sandramycini]NOL43549.1 ergothioneine biosynthesis protein EgtC [Kribbella sandramycini]